MVDVIGRARQCRATTECASSDCRPVSLEVLSRVRAGLREVEKHLQTFAASQSPTSTVFFSPPRSDVTWFLRNADFTALRIRVASGCHPRNSSIMADVSTE